MIIITWNLSVTKAKTFLKNKKIQKFQKLYLPTFDVDDDFRDLVFISIFLFEMGNRYLPCNFSLSLPFKFIMYVLSKLFFQQYFLYFRNYVNWGLHVNVTITVVTNICRKRKTYLTYLSQQQHIWHVTNISNTAQKKKNYALLAHHVPDSLIKRGLTKTEKKSCLI